MAALLPAPRDHAEGLRPRSGNMSTWGRSSGSPSALLTSPIPGGKLTQNAADPGAARWQEIAPAAYRLGGDSSESVDDQPTVDPSLGVQRSDLRVLRAITTRWRQAR
jgi:hypothetical protein